MNGSTLDNFGEKYPFISKLKYPWKILVSIRIPRPKTQKYHIKYPVCENNYKEAIQFLKDYFVEKKDLIRYKNFKFSNIIRSLTTKEFIYNYLKIEHELMYLESLGENIEQTGLITSLKNKIEKVILIEFKEETHSNEFDMETLREKLKIFCNFRLNVKLS